MWLLLAGRGFGKTRCGAEWLREIMCGKTPLDRGLCSHVAIVAETAKDARDTMIGEGRPAGQGSGILQVHPPDFRPTYEPSKRRLVWPNGAIASIYNATEPDQLRGPEHEAAWCDEIAKWQYLDETWDNLQFGLRQGRNPRICITTTPKPIKLLKEIKADPTTKLTGGSTYENRTNLSQRFLATIEKKYEGTRLGRQELHAEILDDVPGALWTRAMLDGLRAKIDKLPDMQRIIVGVDPSGASGDEDDDANDIGIIIAGLGIDALGYVLGDWTCNMSPAGWGARVVQAFHKFGADRIVAEKNFGGAMVEFVIRTADADVPVTMVTASRGKVVRAEPIAALYEQKRVRHVGSLGSLEDELCAFRADGYVGGGSPNRADALVWALSELMLEKPRKAYTGTLAGTY